MLWCCCGQPSVIPVNHEITIHHHYESWANGVYDSNNYPFPGVFNLRQPSPGWASNWSSFPNNYPFDIRQNSLFYSPPGDEPFLRQVLPFGQTVSAVTISQSGKVFNLLKAQPVGLDGPYPLWNGVPDLQLQVWDGNYLPGSTPATNQPITVLGSIDVPATQVTAKHWTYEPNWLALINLLCNLFASSEAEYTVAMVPTWPVDQATASQTYKPKCIASEENVSGGAAVYPYNELIFIESIVQG